MMMKKVMIAAALLAGTLLGGCSNKDDVQNTVNAADTKAISEERATVMPESETAEQSQTQAESEQENSIQEYDTDRINKAESELQDGIYMASFTTDSSMFRVNEACDGKGTLTVENGEMTIHISLGSKKIVNLYPGLAEDAAKDGAALLMPTEDTVMYSDGMTEEVYGFDVPVPVLGTEFDLALIGTKGKWYDHKVSVTEPVPLQENDELGDDGVKSDGSEKEAADLEDGTYTMKITFEGGSGKAQIVSPVTVAVTGKQAVASVQWNSPNYDYMIVDGEKYFPVNIAGDSAFEIPVLKFDEPIDVIGDTVAMSKPHEIEYTITFHSDTAVRQKD